MTILHRAFQVPTLHFYWHSGECCARLKYPKFCILTTKRNPIQQQSDIGNQQSIQMHSNSLSQRPGSIACLTGCILYTDWNRTIVQYRAIVQYYIGTESWQQAQSRQW